MSRCVDCVKFLAVWDSLRDHSQVLKMNTLREGGFFVEEASKNMNLFPQSLQLLEQALSTASTQQRVIAANIANVDTPHYKRRQVDFQAALHNAIQQQSMSSYRTHVDHLPFSSETTSFTPYIKADDDTKFQPNGNNVDMDTEMAKLAQNQLWYNALIERVNGKVHSLRTVINEGR